MLYKLNTNIFIVGGITFLALAVLVNNRAFCLMTLCTFFAFITQMCLLMCFSKDENAVYSSKILFFSTLIYTLFLGFVFMELSYYYEGDTFLFSKGDAMFYFRHSIKVNDIGLIENVKRLTGEFEFEEWGGLLVPTMLLYIIPDKLFVNFVYILTGAASAVMLFRIGKYFMPDSYAAVGALGYSTASYVVFFHCSFLKESIFVFVIICTMYYLYKALIEEDPLAYMLACLFLGLILFFRPAVAAMAIASVMAYYAIIKRGHAISLFLYLGVAIIFAGAIKFTSESFDHYSGGGMDKMIEYGSKDNAYGGGFNYFVSLFAAVAGPFPTLFPKVEGEPITLNYYGAGLMIRQFLIVPFWIGIYYAIKNKVTKLIPLIVFVLFEMSATGFIMASLELRKVMPHIPLMYILMVYGLYQWHENYASERMLTIITNLLAIGILVLWVGR